MSDSNRHWIRDFFVLPILVGVVVAIVTLVLPKVFADSKELSYSIEGPAEVFDAGQLGNVKIEVNGLPAPRLTIYKARVWNSGNLPLKNVPLQISFAPREEKFLIYSLNHRTKPPVEFGSIKVEETDVYSRRFVYELLNPGNEDAISILTSSPLKLSVYSKAEGMEIKAVTSANVKNETGTGVWSALLGLIAMVFAIFANVASRFAKARKSSTQEEGDLVVHFALYGVGEDQVDVTARVTQRVSDGKLTITADNLVLGLDPKPGTPKYLTIVYSYQGQRSLKTVREGSTVALP